jgi:hypothetical protein
VTTRGVVFGGESQVPGVCDICIRRSQRAIRLPIWDSAFISLMKQRQSSIAVASPGPFPLERVTDNDHGATNYRFATGALTPGVVAAARPGAAVVGATSGIGLDVFVRRPFLTSSITMLLFSRIVPVA